MKLHPADVTGALGIFPTPAVEGAEKWSTMSSVNLEQTARMTQIAQKPGINLILTNGTFGEGASMLQSEMPEFVDCIVQNNSQQKPLFVGVTTLNTRETVVRGREILQNPGVTGLFLGRPMWLALDDAGIVKYYRDLAEAFPGVPLIGYDNPEAFKGAISAEAYGEIAKIPEMIALKHTGDPSILPAQKAAGKNMKVFPIDTAWPKVAEQMPEIDCCWTGNIASCPEAVSQLALAMAAGNLEEAKRVAGRIGWALEPMFLGGDFERFMRYSIQIAHLRYKEAGLIDPGPPRPPYTETPADVVEAGKLAGRRLRELQAEFPG